MFNIFKKKSEIEKLERRYKNLLEESYKLSTSNRSKSDAKRAEAEEILDKIELLKKAQKKTT